MAQQSERATDNRVLTGSNPTEAFWKLLQFPLPQFPVSFGIYIKAVGPFLPSAIINRSGNAQRVQLPGKLHRITGRSNRKEATTPSYDLLTAVRTRRHQWLGHILRMPADCLVRRAVLALAQRAGPPYQPGSLLMDTPFPLDELVLRAANRRGWARDTRSLSSLQDRP